MAKQAKKTAAKKPKVSKESSPSTAVSVPTQANSPKKRRLKQKNYQSFRLSKPIKYQGKKLPSAFQLTKRVISILWGQKKLFAGILLIYGLLQIILVQGILGTDFSEINQLVREEYQGSWSWLSGGAVSFAYLIGSVGQSSSAEAGVYQTILLLIASLALIWALRQTLAGSAIRIRDAYYRGMYPLVPFVLVLLVIVLQLLPLAIGTWLYQIVVANGIAVSFIEQAFWAVIAIIFATLSIYMICSSIFALYISALPDMTPMKALRSARALVLYRRRHVVRKVLFLCILLILVVAIIMLPVIIIVPVLAPWVFYILTVLGVGFTHAYMYSLYRELLIDG